MTTEWTYKGKIVNDPPEGALAFVYLITNKKTKRRYVGKKLFFFTRKKKIKGRNRRVLVPSDWKEYYGSNKELQEDVEKLGVSKFKREILHMCSAKGEASYLEVKEQIERGVLLTDTYYNGIVNVKIHKSHVKGLIVKVT